MFIGRNATCRQQQAPSRGPRTRPERQNPNQDGGSARSVLPDPGLRTGLLTQPPRVEPLRVTQRALGPGLSPPRAEERSGSHR
ncbi:hypothetical protein NDU88_001420 [Pleurodeles waltl]|uniref:Uncharacterized protein n=1 Tax=Pleurodeles waltl TaxID=8319 RepID=A0AAV7SZE7_PLEWA|nr:hypothetical protein NDU88_001420 [Pleurodeles waltl]